jgi:plastin-1
LVILFFFACVAVHVSGHVTTKTLSALMKGLNEVASEEEVTAFLSETYPDSDQEIEFESFLRVHASHRFSELLNCNAVRNGAVFSIYSVGIEEPGSISVGVSESAGEGECQGRWRWCWWWPGGGGKTSSSFLKSSTTTLLHSLNQAEKSSYVAHINTYLREDPFLRK